jgi:hypothetical protein
MVTPMGEGPSKLAVAGLDPAIRDRIMREIKPFTDSLNEAVSNPTPEGLDELRAAADELMRAIARALLELARQTDGDGQ